MSQRFGVYLLLKRMQIIWFYFDLMLYLCIIGLKLRKSMHLFSSCKWNEKNVTIFYLNASARVCFSFVQFFLPPKQKTAFIAYIERTWIVQTVDTNKRCIFLICWFHVNFDIYIFISYNLSIYLLQFNVLAILFSGSFSLWWRFWSLPTTHSWDFQLEITASLLYSHHLSPTTRIW